MNSQLCQYTFDVCPHKNTGPDHCIEYIHLNPVCPYANDEKCPFEDEPEHLTTHSHVCPYSDDEKCPFLEDTEHMMNYIHVCPKLGEHFCPNSSLPGGCCLKDDADHMDKYFHKCSRITGWACSDDHHHGIKHASKCQACHMFTFDAAAHMCSGKQDPRANLPDCNYGQRCRMLRQEHQHHGVHCSRFNHPKEPCKYRNECRMLFPGHVNHHVHCGRFSH